MSIALWRDKSELMTNLFLAISDILSDWYLFLLCKGKVVGDLGQLNNKACLLYGKEGDAS